MSRFSELDPKKKRKIIFICMGMGISLLLLIVVATRMSDSAPPLKAPTITKGTKFGEQDAILAERYRKEKELSDKDKELEEAKQRLKDAENKDNVSEQAKEENPQSLAQQNAVQSYPLPPDQYGNLPPLPPRPSESGQEQAPVRKVYGISSVNVESGDAGAAEQKANVKTNFIPATTIIRALTLNGAYAPTRAAGKASPYPVLLRVHDMSFLPNDMQRDLKGCQLLGEAHGEIQEARAHIRITKISCVSRDGNRVLEKDIEGWVNGEDGKVGLAGVIEDNFGMLLTKTFVASTLAGLGDAIQSATQVVTNNPLGGTQTYTKNNYEDIAMSALGTGIGDAFNMIAKFHLDLLKDMSPVVRINARREVDVVIRTGVELNTEDLHWIGVVDKKELEDIDTIISELRELK